jgi:hypothetical protein
MSDTQIDEQYVYHGSPVYFDNAIPKRNIRERDDKVIFDQISFHATALRWIALAYTYVHKQISDHPDAEYYNMGVSLYEPTQSVQIVGIGSLEKSLKQLYGDGGYLLKFKKEDFRHVQGLGPLEVISENPVKPVSIDRVEDPVSEMIKAGVRFEFVDLLKKSE